MSRKEKKPQIFHTDPGRVAVGCRVSRDLFHMTFFFKVKVCVFVLWNEKS